MKSSDRHTDVAVIDVAPAFHARTLTSRRVFGSTDCGAPGSAFRHTAGPGGAGSTDGFEFNGLSDAVLLGWLTANGRRPNVLIECRQAAIETAMHHLMTWCSLPFRYCALPGALELPTPARGTLLLREVGALTLSQQVMLYDWLTVVHGQVQVISLTTTPLQTLVDDGQFLEGLLYRLNVIRIDGAAGTRPAPLDTWHNAAGRMA